MAVVLNSSLAPALTAWRAAFDEAVSQIPLLGRALTPRWRICRVDGRQLKAGTLEVERSVGERPVAVRLATDLGVQTELRLPRAARSDLASAAQLALEAASPIASGYSLVAVDLASARMEGDSVLVTAHVAHRDAVEGAVDLVRRFAGRVDAVDVENPAVSLASPRIDLRTGRSAVRSGVTPATMVVVLSVVSLLAGVAGLGAAAWRNYAASTDAAPAGSPAIQAAQSLLARRKSDPSVLDTVQALSSALPTSAYLETLEISGSSVRLIGRASDAARIPGAIDAHPDLAGAAFSGPTRGISEGRQSFEITLTRAPRSSPK